MSYLLYIALGLSLLAIIYAFFLYRSVLKAPAGEESVQRISGYIKEGANAFIRKEYVIIVIYTIIAFFVIWLSPLGLASAVAFVLGAVFSASAGLIGMRSATDSNCRTTTAAQQHGMQKALTVAFKGGAVMGMSVVGFGLLGVLIVLITANNIYGIPYWQHCRGTISVNRFFHNLLSITFR